MFKNFIVKKLFCLLFLINCISCTSFECEANTPILSKEQKKILNSLDTAVVLPKYIPSGFKVKDLSVHDEDFDTESGRITKQVYSICFSNHKTGEAFSLKTAISGIGSPFCDEQETIYNKIFGRIIFCKYFDNVPDSTEVPISVNYTDWIRIGRITHLMFDSTGTCVGSNLKDLNP